MTQSILTALALCFCGGTLWVRRKSWRIRWDRALTMSFLFQGLGFALSAPAMSHYLEHPLFRISGVAHLRDHELESVLYKIEIPGAIAGGTMLAAITLSHNLSREPPPDFVNVPCDFWLRVYWLTYGAIIIYLLCFVVRLLWVLRRDPRSRLTADLFIIASGLGVVSFGVLLTRIIINPGLLGCFWIWAPSCVAGGVTAFAAAWSWRQRMRRRSRWRPPPIQLGGPES